VPKVLVTGGCGYIGSHTIISLLSKGYEVLSIDNFSNSYSAALQSIYDITGKKVENYNIDLCDIEEVHSVFKDHNDIEAVIHFAALKAVGESVEKPGLYFRNNINSLTNLTDCMTSHGVNHLIFSSSCTVYGQAESLPVTESSPRREAESPYGKTKQVGEDILSFITGFTDLKVISLRYFNPAGAHPSGKIGEAPKVIALNLVPVIMETAIGKRDHFFVHGTDYPTRDGSCIRDYIHIVDLANAHVAAVDQLLSGPISKYEVYNLGIGEGVSVLEAISAFEEVNGMKLNYKLGPRRSGDVIAIYSDFTKAKEFLGWVPQYSIQDIMQTAWAWEQKRSY
jgi:UDP-glucose 4-epimerase